MSKNILQVYTDNPIVTNQGTDLMYFGRAPYNTGDDTAMQFSDFAAQFGAPYTPAALTKVDDTNVTLTLGGTPAIALLHATSLTLGWTGQLSPARGGTGVNNGTNTITIGGNHTLVGAFSSTFTFTNTTSVTFPISGTLATTSQLPTPSALTKVDDTNVTLTLGGTPASSLLQAVSLTLGWTGALSGARGGTGVNNGSSTITIGGSLTTVGAFSSTFTMTNTTSVTFPTIGTLATTSQLPTPAALTKTDDTNVTLTLGGTPLTALLQATSLTMGWTGQLSVPRGGTGLASATAYAVLCGGTTTTGALQSIASVGNSGQSLTSNGAAALPSFQNTGGLKSFQILTSGTAATYTTPAGINSILVDCYGGGAAGGGISVGVGGGAAAGGGGSGSWARKYIPSPAATYTYTVGAAGSPGTAGNNPGGNGGDTTFSTITAGGGIGGTGQPSSSAGPGATGGNGGTATGGDVNMKGGDGQSGVIPPGIGIGGQGGNSILSSSGGRISASVGTSTAGNAATGLNNGCGGGGASGQSVSATKAGGAGISGLIIVWEFS